MKISMSLHADESSVSDKERTSSHQGPALKVMRSKLMMNYDGTMKPLTLRQKLFNKDRHDLLTKKLVLARSRAFHLCKNIEELAVHSDSMRDIALMRKFILENVNIFYRFSLGKCFDKISGAPPEQIDPKMWLLSWVAVIGVYLFLLAWILQWGIINGPTTLRSWGIVYGLGILQSIVIYEVSKLMILFIFAVTSAKPGLQVIKRVINDRALKFVQNFDDRKDELSVVQHFSPACRAARMGPLSHLPSASSRL